MGKISRNLRWIIPVLLVAGGSVWFLAQRRPVRSIILITIDTLRADHVSAYGYARPTSPNLDHFMSRGTVVEWAYSTAASTAPSHASMMVGTYPSYNTVGRVNGWFRLEGAVTTLAELCKSADMRTAAIISNPVLKRALGLDQGFDDYDDDLKQKELNRDSAEQTAPHALAKALAKLDELHITPFFLWLHFQDPHGPYTPPPEWVEVARSLDEESPADGADPEDDADLPVGEGGSVYGAIPAYQVYHDQRRPSGYVARYDGEIAYLDSHLAHLFAHIDSLGLLDHTLVAITSDHGEAMGEDGFYFCHGHSVGLDQVRVPMAFVGPGVKARRLAGPYSNIDVFATILDFLGIEPPEAIQSQSLLPVLRGDRPSPARTAFTEGPLEWGIISGDLYIRRSRMDRKAHALTLEGTQTSGIDFDEVVHELDRYGSGADSVFAAINSRRNETELSPQQLEMLRALGYVK